MLGALDGITILEITGNMSGAIVTMLLCDNGARVIRVENDIHTNARNTPEYAVWDRGKEKFHLNLHKDSEANKHDSLDISSFFTN